MIEVVRGSWQTHVAMALWVPIVLVMFATLPPRRALLAAFMIAWMFLPVCSYNIPLLPGINKMNITVFSVFLGILVFDTNAFMRFKPSWYDIPVFVVILSPIVTSTLVGLGVYDGVSWARSQFITIGLPYLYGRIYLMSPQGMKELAIALFLAGLVYTPFVLWEHRMSPQLHRQIFGYVQHSFMQHMRPGGGFRPMIFMQHGLAVGMWMTMTALAAFWLWRTKIIKSFFNIPMPFYVIGLGVTVLITKSTGAIALYFLGLAALSGISIYKTRWVLILLCLAPMVYVYQNAAYSLDRQWLVQQMEPFFHSARIQSLQYRLDMEDALVRWAHYQPIFGWGRQYMRPGSVEGVGEEITGGRVTDSMWVIAFASRGIVGLTASMALLLVPALLLHRKIPPKLWTHPSFSSVVLLALILVLFMWDNMLNSMPSPVYTLMAGGLMGLSKVRVVRRVAGPEEEMMEEDAEMAPGPVTGKARRRRRVAGGGSPGPGARRRPGSVALD